MSDGLPGCDGFAKTLPGEPMDLQTAIGRISLSEPSELWSPPFMMQDFHRDTHCNRKKTALFCSIASRSFKSISMTKVISPPDLMTDLQLFAKRPHIYSAGCAELAVYS